jgi:DNA-binding transcriptional regulator PaaX
MFQKSNGSLMADEKQNTQNAVLAVVRAAPPGGVSPVEIRQQLTKKGHAEGAVRTAVAELWDAGQLNVGADRRLHPTTNTG